MKISSKVITGAIMAIIILVILFEVYAVLIPEAQDAGNQMNGSNTCEADGCVYNDSAAPFCRNNGSAEAVNCATTNEIPLWALFSGTGVVFVIIMAALIIIVISALLKKGEK